MSLQHLYCDNTSCPAGPVDVNADNVTSWYQVCRSTIDYKLVCNYVFLLPCCAPDPRVSDWSCFVSSLIRPVCQRPTFCSGVSSAHTSPLYQHHCRNSPVQVPQHMCAFENAVLGKEQRVRKVSITDSRRQCSGCYNNINAVVKQHSYCIRCHYNTQGAQLYTCA